MKELIQIKNIKKTYKINQKSFDALSEINLNIFEGEVLGLLGVNGAGKTTLSSIMASLIKPTAGEIFWNNKSIYKNLTLYRKSIGFCPQSQNLDTDLNVQDNLIFAGKYYGLSKKEIFKKKDELLERFDLTGYAKAELKVLSGGYKQRFLIARTLMHSPKFIILDEPTVGLDPQLRRVIWKYIMDLKKANITVVLTTHYLDEADILSDRICVIDKGKIRVVDTPKKLKDDWKQSSLENVFLQLIEEKDEKND